jgi:hypothetical protein
VLRDDQEDLRAIHAPAIANDPMKMYAFIVVSASASGSHVTWLSRIVAV